MSATLLESSLVDKVLAGERISPAEARELYRLPLQELGELAHVRRKQMKRDAYLINIGRGAIVDLTDLTAALDANEIAGAALDVFETEPLPPEHPLWKMPGRVILTPHVAGYSPRIAERHLAVLLDNLNRFVRGEALNNVADKEKWY